MSVYLLNNMTNEMKNTTKQLEEIKQMLIRNLVSGNEYGKKTSIAGEAGWYIGTIKQAIEEIELLIKGA